MSLSTGSASDGLWPDDAERAKYTIGWIAPMPIEFTPALALLDRITTLHVAKGNDTNIYKAGKIGNHHVVMVTLHQIGLGGIPSVAADMHGSFPRLKHLLLVGLGGGVPEYAHGEQMVLGDVVVSRQVENLDSGRRTPYGFQHTHQTYTPSQALLKAVNTLESTRSLHQTRIPQILQGIRQKLPRTIRGNPEDLGPDADRLFDPDYHHKDDAKLCENHCDLKRSKSRQERGPKAYRETDSPFVHYGIIGSGNSLVVGSKEREKFYKELGTICFEMEAAAAVLMEYRCLIIRGISDYSDSHKNKKWQPYAAATAAAYAHELIMTLPAPVHGPNADRSRTPTMNNEEPSTSQNCHWTVPRSRNPLFTGRDDVLRELETTIRKAVKDASYTDQCSIVIYGMGGQGKSEICLQLAYRVRQFFWGVFWVDVSTTSSAKNDFLNIAKKLGIHAESIEEARQGLANVKEPWLLVLDNADDPDADYQRYFPAGLWSVVILTSRNAECHRYASTAELAVKLEGLPGSDARELLLHATDIPREQWGTFHDDAQRVATLLQSHPLALIQAGAYISSAHCTIAEYPRVFNRQRKRLLNFRPRQAKSRYGDVYATFEANSSDDDDSGDLTAWHVFHLPPLLQASANAWDPFRLVEAVQLLKSFSLVSADTHDDFLSVSMHPLTNAWALDRLATAAQHNAWLATGSLVAVSNYDYMLWMKLGRPLQPHIGALASLNMNVMFASESPRKISSIITRCASLLENFRDDAKLKDLMDKLVVYLNLDPLIVDARWLPLYGLIALNLDHFGRAQQAVSLLEQVVQIREHTQAKDHPDRLGSQHELASVYRANGQVKKAVSLLEQVIQIQKQTQAEDHPDRLASQHELARVYQANGQAEKALPLLEHVVQIRELRLAEDHPDRLGSQHELARACQANGQVEKAVSLLEQVVQIREHILSEDHPDRLTSQHQLAGAYQGNDQLEKAVSLQEQVVQIREQILAQDHPDRLVSQTNLATIFWDLGRHEDALQLMRHVVQIRRKALDESHPYLIDSEEWLKIFENGMSEIKPAQSPRGIKLSRSTIFGDPMRETKPAGSPRGIQFTTVTVRP
ncbi:MAG: hypothetical protein Q9208_005361 [Pyrenodesmia sp. 3 TL-2023]